MTAISERLCARFYMYKEKIIVKRFIYKKPDTFLKARQFLFSFIYKNIDTLHYAIFHEIFEIGIYIPKA